MEHKECEEQIKKNISYQYGILLLCMYHVVRQGIVQHSPLRRPPLKNSEKTTKVLELLAGQGFGKNVSNHVVRRYVVK